jgi:hypothetical protein
MAPDPLIPATIDPAVAVALRSALALLFLFAAAHKLRDLTAFRAAVAGYELVPRAGLPLFATMIVAAEMTVGATLLIPAGAALAAVGAAALLATYTIAIGINLLRGRRHIDCGCAGPAGRLHLGPALIARNAFLIGAALGAALPVAARPLLWLDAVTILASVTALCLIYAAAGAALANASRLRDLTAVGARQRLPGADQGLP